MMPQAPLLVVFSGLPGTGKTTVARGLAGRLGAAYLRIDVIEQALRECGFEVGAAGYGVANGLAGSNLALGQSVVADCVNPVRESRAGWQAVAARAGARLFDIEMVCSDIDEHRRRVESRAGDIEGLVLPTWGQVLGRRFDEWEGARLVLDSAGVAPGALVKRCLHHVLGVPD